jgi:hypothetical protein
LAGTYPHHASNQRHEDRQHCEHFLLVTAKELHAIFVFALVDERTSRRAAGRANLDFENSNLGYAAGFPPTPTMTPEDYGGILILIMQFV